MPLAGSDCNGLFCSTGQQLSMYQDKRVPKRKDTSQNLTLTPTKTKEQAHTQSRAHCGTPESI